MHPSTFEVIQFWPWSLVVAEAPQLSVLTEEGLGALVEEKNMQ